MTKVFLFAIPIAALLNWYLTRSEDLKSFSAGLCQNDKKSWIKIDRYNTGWEKVRLRLNNGKIFELSSGRTGPFLTVGEIDCERGLIIINYASFAARDEWQDVFSLKDGKELIRGLGKKIIWSKDRTYAMTYQDVDESFEARDFRVFKNFVLAFEGSQKFRIKNFALPKFQVQELIKHRNDKDVEVKNFDVNCEAIPCSLTFTENSIEQWSQKY